jgi:hypothetical protein
MGLDSTLCHSYRDDPNFERRSHNLGPCLSQRALSHYDECDHVDQNSKEKRVKDKAATSHLNFTQFYEGEDE